MQSTTSAALDPVNPLDVSPPPVSQDQAAAIARRYFGIDATASELSAERDCNFRLETTRRTLLLKVANPADPLPAIEAQTAALHHIARTNPILPVPRVHDTLDGQPMLHWDSPTGPLTVRLLSYLPGTPLVHAPRSPTQRRNVGALLGRLTLALQDFDHPGARRALLWDITRALELDALLQHIGDPRRRALASCALDAFRHHAAPKLATLRTRVIHNDFNPHNLLVDPTAPDHLTGIIDFGDMVHAPMVNDLAIACAYDVPETGHPLSNAAELISAYHAANHLLPMEIDVLFDLIAVRQVVSVTVSAWRASLYPDNRAYIQRNSAAAWHGLERFATLSRDQARSCLRTACRQAA